MMGSTAHRYPFTKESLCLFSIKEKAAQPFLLIVANRVPFNIAPDVFQKEDSKKPAYFFHGPQHSFDNRSTGLTNGCYR
jgi:hypothetical protein